MDAQTASQTSAQKPWLFQPGKSGNPGGVSRAERRYQAFLDVFQGVHGRKPNPIENTQLRNAAAVASRIEGNRIPIEEQVRAGNLLARLVEKLGLDRKPEPPAKSPQQLLQEHIDRTHGSPR
jgi:hypothetical protein